MKEKNMTFFNSIFYKIRFVAFFVGLLLTTGNAQNFYNNPESAVFDSLHNRYLVSNVGTGNIVQIDSNGIKTNFYTQLTRTLGMVIVNDTLFVSDLSGVVGFDLSTDSLIMTIPIAGMNVLNDITADESGYLYLTDSGNGNIYRVKISDQTSSTIVSGIYWPNGILYDKQYNRILFCAFGNSVPIRSINPITFAVSTIIVTNFSDLDGLTVDKNGRIYVSSWGSNSIYRYDQNFSSAPETISTGHNGPADIYFDRSNDILIVPNFNSNSVDFIPISPNSTEEYKSNAPYNFELYQNYPNPFNQITTIKYHLFKSGKIVLKIYNTLGQEIKTLVDEFQSVGVKSVKWNGKDNFGNTVCSGLYFYKLRIDNSDFRKQNKKMLILK